MQLRLTEDWGYFVFSRFVDDALGFALTWNYWFNDAVSTASDIIALQLVLEFWTDNFPGWAISLIFLFVVIFLNVMSVKVYGEVCFAVDAVLIHWLTLVCAADRVLAESAQSRHHYRMFFILVLILVQHLICTG